MAKFLEHLAVRALGAAPVVRPNVATRVAARPSGAPARIPDRLPPLPRRGVELESAAVPTQPRRRAASGTSQPDAHASEAPPVHVTIDRIEVRAVTPPSPPRTSAAPRGLAPLSLDEYLEQRRSGRR